MNRVYRLIWSDIARAYVAVSELTGSRGRRSSSSTVSALGLVGAMVASSAAAAADLPSGWGRVSVDGNATVCAGGSCAVTSGTNMTLTHGGAKFYAELGSSGGGFRIAQGHSVNVIQGAASIALFKDLSGSRSEILGQLSSPGRVFVVNPAAGVLVGRDAVVDVGGFIATSQPITEASFLTSQMTFGLASGGSVVNEGLIRTGTGGFVALLAPSVTNKGLILAPQGTAYLSAGGQHTIRLDSQSNWVLAQRGRSAGNQAEVVNEGRIRGQSIWMGAVADPGQTLGQVLVNNTGVLEATDVTRNGVGAIVLQAAPVPVRGAAVGEIRAAGVISTGRGAEAPSGTSSSILLAGAQVTVSARAGADAVSIESGSGQAGSVAVVSYDRGIELDVARQFTVNGQSYQVVNSVAELQAVGSSGRYVLGNDLDVSGSLLAPLGTAEQPFTGEFLGLGHTIDGLTVNSGAAGGLFGHVRNATVSLLGLSGVTVQGGAGAGALVGRDLGGSSFSKVWASGSVVGESGHTGGLIGALGEASVVDTAYFDGTVSLGVHEGAGVGGLVGQSGGSLLTHVYAKGTVTAGGLAPAAGGLVGINRTSRVAQAYADVSVSSSADSAMLGGLVGYQGETAPAVQSSFYRQQAGLGSPQVGIGLAPAAMRQVADIGNDAGDGLSMGDQWRLYEGLTTPMLVHWLRPVSLKVADVSREYDGQSGQSSWVTHEVSSPVLPYEDSTHPAPAWLTADLRYGPMVAVETRHLAFGESGPWGVSASVGTYSIRVASDQQGYDLDVRGGSLTVTPRLVALRSVEAQDKEYDGTRSATVSSSLDRIVDGDEVGVTLTGLFDTKDAGLSKTVTVQTAALEGADAANYRLVETSAETVADIRPRAITLKALDVTKDEDGIPFVPSVDLLALVAGSFAQGESPSVLSGELSFGPADGQVAPGAWVMQPSGLSGINYDVSFEQGVLTINAVADPTDTSGIVGNVQTGGTSTTPFNTDLNALGDLLSQLPPTAAGEEDDNQKRKTRRRNDTSPLRVIDGGVNAPNAQ